MRNPSSLLIRAIIAFSAFLVSGLLMLHNEPPLKLDIERQRPYMIENQGFYLDINLDGQYEYITQKMTSPEQTSLVVFDENNFLIDQFNIRGRVIKGSPLRVGDYDNNDSGELYLFTHIEDSLFLNIINPYDTSNPIVLRSFIDGTKALDGEALYLIDGIEMYDRDGDGFNEAYFAIGAGFTRQPRAVFRFNIKNNSYIRSPLAGLAPRYAFYSDDIDNDGYPEFWGPSNATGNYQAGEIPFSDMSAWLMIYNHDLEYKFPPVEFSGYTSVLKNRVLEYDNGTKKLVVMRKHSIKEDDIHNELCLFSVEGELEKKILLNDYQMVVPQNLYLYKDRIYVHDGANGRISEFNSELEFIRNFDRPGLKGWLSGPMKLMDTDKLYLVFSNPDGDITVHRPDVKTLASFDFGNIDQVISPLTFVRRPDMDGGFYLKTFKSEYLISVRKNLNRPFVLLYSLIILFASYYLVYFIQNAQLKQERKKQEDEKKLRTLQIQSVKSQMSPHFIYNALNSISAMYIKGDTDRADSFLTSFSKMIREVVDSSDRIIVDMSEELNFVTNYPELQKVRFDGRLSYNINVPDRCSEVMIPSMTIHTFVENSIKHGFAGSRKKLNIDISANCSDKKARLTITDNGIGIERSRGEEDRDGKGMRLVKEIFEAYYLIKKKQISYNISDLAVVREGEHGTLVEIEIEL